MKNYSLIPIQFAQNALSKVFVTHLTDPDKFITIPVCVYYIQGPEQNIIIDSGTWPLMPPEMEERRGEKDGQIKGSWNRIVSGLAKLNLKPEDIDIVIVSHAHFEHMGFIKEWKNAKFIIQKDEYEHAVRPIAPYRHVFLPEKIWELENHIGGMEIIDGDVEIVPGVSVMKCPGHTPGMQAVCIESSEGLMIYASDLINIYHNMYPWDERLGTPYRSTFYIPPGYYINMRECVDSFQRIKAKADIIIPGHEHMVADAGKIPPEPYKPERK